VNSIRFPKNQVEDFDQAYVSASLLHSFERRGSPLLYVTAFTSVDHAKREFDNGVAGTSTKSKTLGGVRSYAQYSINPKLQLFNGLGVILRKDQGRLRAFHGGREGQGRLRRGEPRVAWQFREKCALRLQYAYSHNSSNIDIYDFKRSEVSSTIAAT